MCEEIDEYIIYEFDKDEEEENDDDDVIEQDDDCMEECLVVEELDDTSEQITETVEEEDEENEIKFDSNEFVLPSQISQIVDGELYEQIADEELNNSQEYIEANDVEDEEEQKPATKHNANAPKGPKRYLLFDELIATIVDYDADNTPIVEFSMSGLEADEKLPVECGICPDVMHKLKLSSHLKTHQVTGTNRYQCIYCDETYKDYKYLAGHARRHMGIRPYVCEPCKLYFSTKQDLRVHNQRRHQEKEHICEICGKTFAQNTQLKRHRESTHEKKRRFQCPHCSKAYYKNFALQEHIRGVHMGNRRMLVCPFCGMQCRDAHKMARHRKELHLNQKHYVCHICQEEFTDISYFDAHKRSIQCRNNTRRKLEEEEQQVQQQIEDDVVYEITLDSNETN